MFYPEKFKLIRIEKKITQLELADALGKRRLSIIRWENKQTNPSECDIRAAAQYMDISVSDISDLKDFEHINKSFSINMAELNGVLKANESVPPSIRKKFNDLKTLLFSLNDQLTVYRREKNSTDFLIQNLPFIIYTKNASDFKYKYVNDAFLTLLPVTESSVTVIGCNASHFFGMKEYEKILMLEKKVILQKHREKQVLPIPGSSGRKIGVFSVVPVIEKGKVSEICCTVQDITDEYAEEKARLELEKAVNKLNDFIWIGHRKNPSNLVEPIQFTYISDSFITHWGLEKEQLLSGERKLFTYVHPEDKEDVEKWYYSSSYPKKKEFRFLIKNEVKYALMQAFNEGDLFWGTMTDITERTLLEKKRLALESAVNHLNVLIWVGYRDNPEDLSAPITYSYISDSCETYWKIPKAPLFRGEKILSDYIYPQDQGAVHKWYSSVNPGKTECRALINKQVKDISLQVFKKDKIVWGIVADIGQKSSA